MFYSCAGSSILLLIAGCITTNFMSLLFSTFRSSSLWGIDTIIFAKLDKHPLSMKHPPPPPLLRRAWNKWALLGDLTEDLRYPFRMHPHWFDDFVGPSPFCQSLYLRSWSSCALVTVEPSLSGYPWGKVNWPQEEIETLRGQCAVESIFCSFTIFILLNNSLVS